MLHFPVDSTIGDRDPVVSLVRQKIVDVVSKERYIQRKISISWLAVFDELTALRTGRKRQGIELAEVTMAKRKHVSIDEVERVMLFVFYWIMDD